MAARRAHKPWRTGLAHLLAVAVLLMPASLATVDACAQAVRSVGEARLTGRVGGHEVQVPYYSNYPLDLPNPALERAVIAVHGSDRNASSIYKSILAAAKSAEGADERTLIVCPQFLSEEDVQEHDLGPEVLRWAGRDQYWRQGHESVTPPSLPASVHVSSFAVLDEFVRRVANRDLFPNLKIIVVTGISSGGQMVQRFAAGSRVEQTLKEIHVRYVPAAPATYLYFNGERRVEGTVDQFATPSWGSSERCSGYDDYGYGLWDLNPYMASVGAARIRAQYSQREVIYLIGSEDTAQGLTDCGAMIQGDGRLQRANIFYNYLQHYFGPGIVAHHKLVVVEGVGHSYDLFASAQGLQCLLDYPQSTGTHALLTAQPRRRDGVEAICVDLALGMRSLPRGFPPWRGAEEALMTIPVMLPQQNRGIIRHLIGWGEEHTARSETTWTHGRQPIATGWEEGIGHAVDLKEAPLHAPSTRFRLLLPRVPQ